MGPLQAHTQTPRKDSTAEFHGQCQPFGFATPADGGDMISRHEPQRLVERIVPRDPYAAWLEHREAERELDERPQVRWVHRQRDTEGRGIVAGRL